MGRIFYAGFVVAMMAVIVTSFIYYSYHVYGVKRISVDYEVTKELVTSFNTDTDALHLGAIPLGSSAERKFSLKEEKDSFVVIEAKNISYLKMSPNYFFMPKNNQTEVAVIADIPLNAQPGHYRGYLKVTLRRPDGK